ncbi:hypothetical protein SBDP1_1070004 [Syntrophobacter sp. SbD1]|nr:hypothetical protein SBDP1_1070004 [Syntrophobacter sp. SbD1]
MTQNGKLYTPVQGKTYSLFADSDDPLLYFAEIRRLADMFLKLCPDKQKLLDLIPKAGKNLFWEGLKTGGADRKTLRFIRETLRQSLSIYTQNVSQHLKSLPVAKSFDATLTTTEDKYHLYMLEIELVNRIHKEGFKREQETLFRRLKQEHPSIGALGIACIPELAAGMRLCIRAGIPPVGIQLNANRCARWMSQAHETSFSLEQLEELLM